MRGQMPLGLGVLGLAFLLSPVVATISSRLLDTTESQGRLVAVADTITMALPEEGQERSECGSTATFRVVNRGNKPVAIRSVRNGCDCTMARVEPGAISPGAVGSVEVRVDSSARDEDRTVLVTLITDSRTTPEVDLHLRLIGKSTPKPPYLLSASGDLVYHGRARTADVREIAVTTIQETGRHDEPRLTSTLPYLKLEPSGFQARVTTEPAYSLVVHTYAVRLTAPPEGRFEGEVLVADPWNRERGRRIRVFGENPGPVAIIPPRLLLYLDGAMSDAGRAVLRVHQESEEVVRVNPDNSATSLLAVTPLPSDEAGVSLFEVRLRGENQLEAGETTRLIVRPSSPSSDPILVPVKIIDGVTEDEATD